MMKVTIGQLRKIISETIASRKKNRLSEIGGHYTDPDRAYELAIEMKNAGESADDVYSALDADGVKHNVIDGILDQVFGLGEAEGDDYIHDPKKSRDKRDADVKKQQGDFGIGNVDALGESEINEIGGRLNADYSQGKEHAERMLSDGESSDNIYGVLADEAPDYVDQIMDDLGLWDK